MRGVAESCICVTMAVGLISCGGGDSSGSGGGPSPTPQSLTITPGTTILKVDQTEVFGGSVTLSNGQSQTVQPTWQSDNTTVLRFEGGAARGRSNGTATIIGTSQGLTATRLIRVATNYQGTWVGEYIVRGCDSSGDFRAAGFCNSEDGFFAGQVLEVAFDLTQDRDDVTGEMFLGAVEGTTRGRVEADGRFTGTGSLTVSDDGFVVAFTVNPLNVNADGNRMTGTFTVSVTAPGISGQGLFTAEILTVVRVASGLAPTATAGASTLDLTAFMRRLRR